MMSHAKIFWSSKTLNRLAALSSVLGASVLYVGCGVAPANQDAAAAAAAAPPAVVSPIVTNACAAGQFDIGWGCFTATDFQSACNYGYGQLGTAPSSGVQVCRTVFNSNVYFRSSGLPTLLTGDVTGSRAFNTGLQLRVGDQLNFSGTGGWGSSSVSVKSRLGGLFHTYTTHYNCDEVSLNGLSDDSVAATYAGEAAALYGTDGTERFLVGSSLSKQITNAGTLKLGFNADPYTASGCSTLTITSLRVTRCMGVDGNTYPCQ